MSAVMERQLDMFDGLLEDHTDLPARALRTADLTPGMTVFLVGQPGWRGGRRFVVVAASPGGDVALRAPDAPDFVSRPAWSWGLENRGDGDGGSVVTYLVRTADVTPEDGMP